MRTVTLIFLTLFSLLSLSCNFISDDVTDFDFILPEKEFTVDSSQFGIQINETAIPEVACPGTPSCADLGENFQCGTDGFCEAEASYDLKSDIIVLKDEVEEFAVITSQDHISVSFKYIQMQVVTNTLNFDLPPLDLYIAPQSVTALRDAQGDLNSEVRMVGTLDTIQAGKTGYYDVNLAPAGQDTLTSFVQHPDVPFYLFVSGTSSFGAGDSVPAGALTVRVHSRATASIN
ncbi:hypothetical protein KKF84_00075 [Myxococcota bacterium]|nr:hypothetical protein [Myxococcota bacterium]MBU1533680.1 hypothetical protein [Myxococcota bacterium]